MPVSTVSYEESRNATAPESAAPPDRPSNKRRRLSQRLREREHARQEMQLPAVPDAEEEAVCVLTFIVSSSLHKAMTNLRQRYFPSGLNKLDAHVTLFHALPVSKLESDIYPALKEIAANSSPYQIMPGGVFALGKRGFAVRLAHGNVRAQYSKQVYEKLQEKWQMFLSRQDMAAPSFHWTLMNKVTQPEKVQEAMDETTAWLDGHATVLDPKPVQTGFVEGLCLWRYDDGRWKDPERFVFAREKQERGGVRKVVSEDGMDLPMRKVRVSRLEGEKFKGRPGHGE